MISFSKNVKGRKISVPRDVADILIPRFARKRQEHFVALTLNGGYEVIRGYVLTIGLADRTLVAPREVFYPAIVDNAIAVVLSHNHPSGNLQPSPQDLTLVQTLKDSGDILHIRVLDHLIVSTRGYYSWLDHGLLEPAKPPGGITAP